MFEISHHFEGPYSGTCERVAVIPAAAVSDASDLTQSHSSCYCSSEGIVKSE